MPLEHLYVHVPFCARKCDYCAFYSGRASRAQVEQYLAALDDELDLIGDALRPVTIFFGGGTPSLLTADQWRRVLSGFERRHWTGAAEWTIECNPATVTLEKAQLWREHGVNRISMGVQSLEPALLERLGRVHSPEQVVESVAVFRRAGFDNLNLDLMFAIPGQTLADWNRTLDRALELEPEHLSCYEVIYEEDTPLYAQLQAGAIDEDPELAATMYEVLRERLDQAGYTQYEVANFARGGDGQPTTLPARACRHNVNTWRGGEYFGAGPSASGHEYGERVRNASDLDRYCRDLLEKQRRPVEMRERLGPLARAGEAAAFGLRMTSGWSLAAFRDRTGFDLTREWRSEIGQLVALGYGELTEDRFRLTAEGLRYADWAAELFLRLEERDAAVDRLALEGVSG